MNFGLTGPEQDRCINFYLDKTKPENCRKFHITKWMHLPDTREEELLFIVY